MTTLRWILAAIGIGYGLCILLGAAQIIANQLLKSPVVGGPDPRSHPRSSGPGDGAAPEGAVQGPPTTGITSEAEATHTARMGGLADRDTCSVAVGGEHSSASDDPPAIDREPLLAPGRRRGITAITIKGGIL